MGVLLLSHNYEQYKIGKLINGYVYPHTSLFLPFTRGSHQLLISQHYCTIICVIPIWLNSVVSASSISAFIADSLLQTELFL